MSSCRHPTADRLYPAAMCRSIKTLRRPETAATTGELEAAARQYVRKISGYRTPSARNAEAFEAAIAEIAAIVEPAARDLRGGGRGRPGPLDAAGDRQRVRRPMPNAASTLLSTPAVVAPLARRSPDPRDRSVGAGRLALDSAAIGRLACDERDAAHASPRSSLIDYPPRMLMTAAPWWVRPGLDIDTAGRLRIAGRDAEALVREHGTPLFAYDRVRFAENARRFQAALERSGLPYRLRFAMKANPYPEILEVFRGLGAPGTPESVGIDACSPGEVLRALDCGWRPGEISYTGTNVSERDLDVLLADRRARQPRRDQPDRAIRTAGARIDGRPAHRPGDRRRLQRPPRVQRLPADEVRHRPRSTRRCPRGGATARPLDRHGPFPRRLRLARRRARRVRGRAAGRRRRRPYLRAAGHDITEVNVGGGLGMPAREDERAVDLDAYAAVLRDTSARSTSSSPANPATT